MTLTRREREVAVFLLLGLTAKEISTRLSISSRTVEDHILACLRKFGVRSTISLVHELWKLAQE
jgi:DNA-binding NarL/FixJ family response regulator